MKLIVLSILIIIAGPDAKARSSFLPNSFKADFFQVIKSSISNKEKKMKGKIDYKYPGHIWFEATYPDKIVFVSNPEKSWYYIAPWDEEEPGELTISNTNKNSLVRFFDLLRKGLKSNKMYTVKKVKEGRLISFNKKNQKEMGISSARISFKGKEHFKNISKVILVRTDKSQVRLELNAIQPGLSFKKTHFIFKAPKNTRISQ